MTGPRMWMTRRSGFLCIVFSCRRTLEWGNDLAHKCISTSLLMLPNSLSSVDSTCSIPLLIALSLSLSFHPQTQFTNPPTLISDPISQSKLLVYRIFSHPVFYLLTHPPSRGCTSKQQPKDFQSRPSKQHSQPRGHERYNHQSATWQGGNRKPMTSWRFQLPWYVT